MCRKLNRNGEYFTFDLRLFRFKFDCGVANIYNEHFNRTDATTTLNVTLRNVSATWWSIWE